MIEFLNQIDTNIFLFLNSLHHPFIDPIMLHVSYSKLLFLGIVLGLSAYGIYIYRKWFALAFFFCLIAFGASDRISSGFFKPTFERLRPCHNPELAEKVHLAGRKCWGGKFGFISSHASNSFSFAIFFWLLFRKRNKLFALLIPYAGLVSYSRIYLAKHYPGDIFFGALLGLACGYIAFISFDRLRLRYSNQS